MSAGLFDTPTFSAASELEQQLPLMAMVRLLEPELVALSAKYGIVSFGVFGSRLRGEARPDSDLDVLVEFRDKLDYRVRDQLQQELSEIIGVSVDLVPFENLDARPYFARNVLRSVVWLQKGGALQQIQDETLVARIHDDGDDMEPKREYMDFILDMITSMQNAMEFVQGIGYTQMLSDRKTLAAVSYEIQTIGEAARKIPADVRALYPALDWKNIIGIRNRLAHDYDKVDYEILWKILHEDIPHDLMFVQDMFEREKKRRQLEDI